MKWVTIDDLGSIQGDEENGGDYTLSVTQMTFIDGRGALFEIAVFDPEEKMEMILNREGWQKLRQLCDVVLARMDQGD